MVTVEQWVDTSYDAPDLIDLAVPVPSGLIERERNRPRLRRRKLLQASMILGGVALSFISSLLASQVVTGLPFSAGFAAVVLLLALVRGFAHWRLQRGDVSRRLGISEEILSAVRIVTIGSVVTILSLFLVGSSMQISTGTPGFFFLEWLMALSLWAGYLVGAKLWLGRRRRGGANTRTVLMVGATTTARKLATSILDHPETGFRIAGIVPVRDVEGQGLPEKATGGPDLPQLIRELNIDEVVFSSMIPRPQLIRLVSSVGPHVGVKQLWSGTDAAVLRANTTIAGFPVHDLLGEALDRPQAVLKRTLDLAVAVPVLTLSLPVLLLSALAIRATSRGPMLFRQVRAGLHGRPFTVYKLRTMRVDTDSSQHEEYIKQLMLGAVVEAEGKYKRTPQTTQVGRFLRKLSIDELPQLFNVLNGTMSIVGPRPPMLYELPLHEAHHLRRLDVKPGMTGLWQVSGRNRMGYREMVEIDLRYIDGWSLPKDLRIILKTPRALLRTRDTS